MQYQIKDSRLTDGSPVFDLILLPNGEDAAGNKRVIFSCQSAADVINFEMELERIIEKYTVEMIEERGSGKIDRELKAALASASPTAIWGIWCQVSGGVTGSRQAWLKNEKGAIWEGSETEARDKASELMAGSIAYRSGATFVYSPKIREAGRS